MTTSQLPAIILVIPLFASFVCGLCAFWRKELTPVVVLIALAATLVESVELLFEVFRSGTLSYHMAGWVPAEGMPPIGIELVVDRLNGMVACIIAFVAFINMVHWYSYIREEFADRLSYFCTMYLLLTVGLLGMTITGDIFNLYVLIEITSLSSYALLAAGRGRAYLATFNYLIMGTIGASFYLLGVGYLYSQTGSLNMADVQQLLVANNLYSSKAVFAGFLLIMVGLWTKMAFFPLHGWLPNVYTYAPSPISSFIAPLATKVCAYVMIRVMFWVFTPLYIFETLGVQPIIVSLAAVAIVVASFYALAQKELKKMISYVVVAEVGYIVGGVWLANKSGYAGATFHILADALMTMCLFMFAGIVAIRTGGLRFANFEGLFQKMPITMCGFLVIALSMIGVPPTCGFFSKWYLLSGAYEGGHWDYMIALLFSSLVNVVLFFKIIEASYFSQQDSHGDDDHGHGDHSAHALDEAPVGMLVPFMVACFSLIVVGIYSQRIISEIIVPSLPA